MYLAILIYEKRGNKINTSKQLSLRTSYPLIPIVQSSLQSSMLSQDIDCYYYINKVIFKHLKMDHPFFADQLSEIHEADTLYDSNFS
jgi:hypothetical protein